MTCPDKILARIKKYTIERDELRRPLEQCPEVLCLAHTLEWAKSSSYLYALGPGFEIHWSADSATVSRSAVSTFSTLFTAVTELAKYIREPPTVTPQEGGPSC